MVKRKKIILIAGLLIFLLVRLYTKGHSIDVYFKAKSWTKYIKNKDAEKMVKLFCSDIKNNSYHNTLEELVVNAFLSTSTLLVQEASEYHPSNV